MNMKTLAAATIAAAFGVMGAAQAATVTIQNVTAEWTNIDPNSITADPAGATTSMFWGSPATNSGQSGYTFASSGDTTVPVPPDQMFDLGTFTHTNRPIFASGDSLLSTTLEVTAEIVIDSISQGFRTFSFDFTHNETDNGANPCANGEPNNTGVNANGCADLITITNASLNETFNVAGVAYTIAILGFDAGSGLVSQFETMEDAINTALLKAIITSEIPLPGALPLFFAGLAGIGFASRRKAAA